MLLRCRLKVSPEKDEGWLSLRAEGQDGAEIGIGREQDSVFGLCKGEDFRVLGALQAALANVNGIMARA